MISYNVIFPLNDDKSKNNFFKMAQTTKDALTSDLLLLLLTKKGERYYMPNYGCSLLKFIFEPNDSISANDVEEEIKTTVSQYIPALKITNVTFNTLVDDAGNEISENQLNVNVRFTYSENTFSDTGELNLTF